MSEKRDSDHLHLNTIAVNQTTTTTSWRLWQLWPAPLPFMVQTRSAVKRQQAEHRLATAPKNLVRDATVVEITSSATGLGTSICCLWPPQGPNEIPEILSPDMTLDPRFVTPVPHLNSVINTGLAILVFSTAGLLFTSTSSGMRSKISSSPPSSRRGSYDRIRILFQRCWRDPSIWHDPYRYIQEHPSASYSSFTLPRTRVEASTPLSLGPHGTHLDIASNNFGPTGNQRHDTALQLVPHGTHLDISQDNSSSTFNQASPGFTPGFTGGLGLNDTVLIGPDGWALRLGY